MKFIGKAFLTLVFILLFIPFLFSASLKFQFLSPDYWVDSFRQGDIYPKLETLLKSVITAQTKKGELSSQEARVWTGILTSGTLQDFIEKNIKLSLDFANGREKEQKFYVPFEKLPKNLIPAELTGNLSNEITPQDLGKLLGPDAQVSKVDNKKLSRAGINAAVSLLVSLSLLIGILILMYLLVEPGGRLVTPGVGLILSSLITLGIIGGGTLFLGSAGKEMFFPGSESASRLLGAVIPPVVKPMFTLWKSISLVTLILGVFLLFVRKPSEIAKKVTPKKK
jgi:hypothetical protein